MATQTALEKGKSTPPETANKQPVSQTRATQAKSITDAVEARVAEFVRNGQLHLPKNYSAENAMKSAYLILQGVEDKDGKPALEVCTRESIANSLLDMIVQGLNPSKKQGYFIVYGKTLTFQRSYMGSMAVAQMVNPTIADWGNAVVYADDTFKYGIKNGKKIVSDHEQDIKNVDKSKIVAAYSIALDKDGNPLKTEIATMAEIMQSWKQSKMHPVLDNGKIKPDSTHDKFTADMALKTVINKNCKIIINASSDNQLLLERINRNEDLADAAAVQVDIAEHANAGEVLQITEGAVVAEQDIAEAHQTDEHPVCVCDEMTKEHAKEWDCPVHGRYQGGRFTPVRKPGF